MAENVTGKWSYSTNEEMYYGQFETKQGAINECRERGGGWVGRSVPPTPPWHSIDGSTVSDIIENTCEHEDYYGDWADGWDRSTEDQREELAAEFRRAAREWYERHGLMPTFWVIDPVTIEPVELEEPADG